MLPGVDDWEEQTSLKAEVKSLRWERGRFLIMTLLIAGTPQSKCQQIYFPVC